MAVRRAAEALTARLGGRAAHPLGAVARPQPPAGASRISSTTTVEQDRVAARRPRPARRAAGGRTTCRGRRRTSRSSRTSHFPVPHQRPSAASSSRAACLPGRDRHGRGQHRIGGVGQVVEQVGEPVAHRVPVGVGRAGPARRRGRRRTPRRAPRRRRRRRAGPRRSRSAAPAWAGGARGPWRSSARPTPGSARTARPASRRTRATPGTAPAAPASRTVMSRSEVGVAVPDTTLPASQAARASGKRSATSARAVVTASSSSHATSLPGPRRAERVTSGLDPRCTKRIQPEETRAPDPNPPAPSAVRDRRRGGRGRHRRQRLLHRTGRLGDLQQRLQPARRTSPSRSAPTAPPRTPSPAPACLGKATQDPTTAAERRANAAYVAENRSTPDPRLTTTPVREARQAVPEDRYAMAGGCYSMAGQPIRFQATDLGSYLLYTRDESFVSADGLADEPSETPTGPRRGATAATPSGSPTAAGSPPPAAASPPATSRSGFSLQHDDRLPALPRGRRSASPVRRSPAPRPSRRCAATSTPTPTAWPSSSSAAASTAASRGTGTARRTRSSTATTTRQTQGHGAVLESILSGEPSHDPVGWPTFKDWPAPNSLTHEGTYYRWLERSWRGGQRLFVNLLVENNQLCELYPLPPPNEKNSCDDMDSIRLQAKRMYEMQDYIDAQFGGPGEGFYRIVKSPWQARRVINAGKMAVVMGIETSVPFGCTLPPGEAHLRSRLHRPPARRGARPRGAADGAGQQVRQRALRRGRRQRRGRRGGQQRATSARPTPSGTCGTASPSTPTRTTRTRSRRPRSAPSSRTRCSVRSVSCSAPPAPPCRSTRRPTTATSAASPRWASTPSRASPNATCSSTPTT